MVLAFCRRGSVIPICLYLLVGRSMKIQMQILKNFIRRMSPRMTPRLISFLNQILFEMLRQIHYFEIRDITNGYSIFCYYYTYNHYSFIHLPFVCRSLFSR